MLDAFDFPDMLIRFAPWLEKREPRRAAQFCVDSVEFHACGGKIVGQLLYRKTSFTISCSFDGFSSKALQWVEP